MTFDWSISLGSIITAVSMFGGVLLLSFRLGSATAQFESLKGEITEIQKEMRQIANAMAQLAVQDARIKGMETDIRDLKSDIRDLRKGEGFILPLDRGAHER